MNLLEKHRDNYKKLKKKELHAIIEEQLYLNRKKLDKRVYNPLYSKRNNSRRALRKFWDKRHTDVVTQARVRKHLGILKDIRDKGEL